MDIYTRFRNLPRARRGTEVIVIVPEAELADLLGAAQAREAALFLRGGTVPVQDPIGRRAEPIVITDPRCFCVRGPHGGSTCPNCR